MKKVFLIMLVVLTFGSAAFAQELDLKQMPFPERTGYQMLASREKEQVKDFASRVKQKVNTINKNRLIIKDLQFRSNNQIRQIKRQIKELRNNPGTLDRNKIANINQLLKSINQNQQALESNREAMNKKRIVLRAAIKSRKPALFLQTLEEIILIQEKRINALNEMFADLNRLSNELR
ncbi:MAG TPA: hypothetical protein DCM26_03015 [Desulfotomaculum sp.]|nr:hypothetical protein [Desulfotomaculum sp.]